MADTENDGQDKILANNGNQEEIARADLRQKHKDVNNIHANADKNEALVGVDEHAIPESLSVEQAEISKKSLAKDVCIRYLQGKDFKPKGKGSCCFSFTA